MRRIRSGKPIFRRSPAGERAGHVGHHVGDGVGQTRGKRGPEDLVDRPFRDLPDAAERDAETRDRDDEQPALLFEALEPRAVKQEATDAVIAKVVKPCAKAS